ncbi:hypothetical protein F7725_020102, partial [Dissostichus mawsoni]
MPEHCAAYCCANRRTIANRGRGITFHKFPKDKDMRKKWEVALRREGFTASESSVICSEHFKQDRTGIVTQRWCYSLHLQLPGSPPKKSLSVAPQDDPEASTSHSQPQPNDDHSYVLPASPTALKARLNEALARVESLERERKNAMAREKRAKTTVRSLLGDLREKNLINEELKERLDFYSDLQIDFKAKQGHEYSKDHREWLCSVDGKPGLNKMMLDMLERRCQEDQATYGCVALMLDAMAIRKHHKEGLPPVMLMNVMFGSQPLSLHFGHIAAITQKQWLKMLTQSLNFLVSVRLDCTDVLWHIVWIEDLSSQEHRVCGESRKPLRDAVSDSVDYFHPLVAEGLIRRRMVADSHSLKFKNTSAACAGEGIEDRTQVRARCLPLSEQSSLRGHNPTPDRGKGQLICLEVQPVLPGDPVRFQFDFVLSRFICTLEKMDRETTIVGSK